ncbi:peptidyl-alpha-hydroxyglycine alpha-amidating lyase family protein [Litorilinea aerophila]|uniref:6-bladed beta-propeller n=1 Tax=Litorilinea aerophila TaxID=1204385 RepID=A0A540VB37_9CHLR|nr:peptidyl-alpha-hydroxyglycine alpha-amidating lyase family protein [Litorilinea aerophila]MCC9078214.1 peptidyl-alpha-hydroxyglycine alpha-amidating lyase family protein [Litorilinea aerophila]
MPFGAGRYTYEVIEHWAKLPEGWTWGWIPAVAVDSRDRVFVYSRSEHPLVIFDTEGNFLDSWGEGILQDAHGIFIDAEDNVYCTERNTHCVHKFDRHGRLLLTLGTPGQQGAADGDPFRLPTDLAVASTGELFVSDGYGNARVHKFSPDGRLLLSWGEWGDGPGQFALSHCVRVDRYDRVWVCDRTNCRIQIFDTEGNFLDQWTGLAHPDTIHFDPHEDVVYVAELDQQVSIYTLEGELLAQWGGRCQSERPGEFRACPHGIWTDSRGDLYVGEVQTDGRLQKFVRLDS